MQKAN